MLKFVDNIELRLLHHLRSGDVYMVVSRADARKLNAVGEGNHIYLSLKYGRSYEIVKYEHHEDIPAIGKPARVQIIRDALGTGAKSFPRGTCVVADLNSIQLRELVCQYKEECE